MNSTSPTLRCGIRPEPADIRVDSDVASVITRDAAAVALPRTQTHTHEGARR